MAPQPAWKRRFTAPTMAFPRWSPAAPDRCVMLSNESGLHQMWVWDVVTGERRQASYERVGVEAACTTPDGSGVVWWVDRTGDERGHWVVAPFGGGEPRPLVSGMPDAWAMGVSMAPGLVALGISDEQTYSVYIAPNGGAPMLLARQPTFLCVGHEWIPDAGGLSADGRLLCLIDGTRGDISHLTLRVIDAMSGESAGEQFDDGFTLSPLAWSPAAGDQRLLFLQERSGIERPAIWDLARGERRDLDLDVAGPIEHASWWPGASALLLVHQIDGRSQLLRYELEKEHLEELTRPAGHVSDAGVRPDGEVWVRSENAAEPPRIATLDGREIVAPNGERAPKGSPYRSLEFTNPGGQRVHGFLATPAGAGPFPIVMMVHGGPEWAVPNMFDPSTQAFVDHGYAVAQVNYRGSSGYGVAWRQALIGNIGFPETEDVLAGLDHLIEEGIADPDRAVIEGWSWGGYIALLAIGLHPDRFVASIGGIPVGDLESGHYECAPALQAYDLAMLGGSPEEKPEIYRERSPLTYANAAARVPILIIAGENDSRCPIGQVRRYVDAIRVRGGEIRLHTYDSGHHANSIDEQLKHAELELAFLHEHVPGGPSSG